MRAVTSRGMAKMGDAEPLIEAIPATAGIRDIAVVIVPTAPTAQASTNRMVRADRALLAFICIGLRAVVWC
jgi:hypothetical protein